MTKQEQVIEMARAVCGCLRSSCEQCDLYSDGCVNIEKMEKLYNKGYRLLGENNKLLEM